MHLTELSSPWDGRLYLSRVLRTRGEDISESFVGSNGAPFSKADHLNGMQNGISIAEPSERRSSYDWHRVLAARYLIAKDEYEDKAINLTKSVNSLLS